MSERPSPAPDHKGLNRALILDRVKDFLPSLRSKSTIEKATMIGGGLSLTAVALAACGDENVFTPTPAITKPASTEGITIGATPTAKLVDATKTPVVSEFEQKYPADSLKQLVGQSTPIADNAEVKILGTFSADQDAQAKQKVDDLLVNQGSILDGAPPAVAVQNKATIDKATDEILAMAEVTVGGKKYAVDGYVFYDIETKGDQSGAQYPPQMDLLVKDGNNATTLRVGQINFVPAIIAKDGKFILIGQQGNPPAVSNGGQGGGELLPTSTPKPTEVPPTATVEVKPTSTPLPTNTPEPTVNVAEQQKAEVDSVLKQLHIDTKKKQFNGEYSIKTNDKGEKELIANIDGTLRLDGMEVTMGNGEKVFERGIAYKGLFPEAPDFTVVIDIINDKDVTKRFGIENPDAFSKILKQLLARQQGLSVADFEKMIKDNSTIKLGVPTVLSVSGGNSVMGMKEVNTDLNNTIFEIRLASGNAGMDAVEYFKDNLSQDQKDQIDKDRIIKTNPSNYSLQELYDINTSNGINRIIALEYSTITNGEYVVLANNSISANVKTLNEILLFGLQKGTSKNVYGLATSIYNDIGGSSTHYAGIGEIKPPAEAASTSK